MAVVILDKVPIGYIGYVRCEGYAVKVIKHIDTNWDGEKSVWIDEATGFKIADSVPVFDTEGEAVTGRARKAQKKIKKTARTHAEMSAPKEDDRADD